MAKALSKELGPHGIRVNSVDPGPVATDLWLGKGGVAEVADLVLVLASPRFGNVTGSNVVIDGGLISTL